MRIGRVRCKPRVPRRSHAPRCPRRSLRRRDPARACRVAAGDFEGLSCRGDDVDFQRDRKTGNRLWNVPPAPSVGGFLSADVARTLGSNSPSRRTDLACPATPSPGMQDDSVTRNHLARCAGRRAAPIGAPARAMPSRFEVALSKNPKTARRSRVAPAERRPRPPALPRKGERHAVPSAPAAVLALIAGHLEGECHRESDAAQREPPLPRPVARFAAKPSAAPLTLRTRPSALER